MKLLTYLTLCCATLALSETAFGQFGGAPIVSPQVHDDNTVTFRLRAPRAQSVQLSGQFLSGNQEMKNENGVWSVTVGPVEPNLYPYNFVVDGVQVADPQNQDIFPNEGFKASLVDVPGKGPDDEHELRAVRDVPHGDMTYSFVNSEHMGRTRPLVVYTPPGYRDSDRLYPVFYLVSGTTDTEETWFRAGRANFILDNLIAEGKAEPMIVVMPYGNMLNGQPRPNSPEAAAKYKEFADELFATIMPFVEKNYRTLNDREHRAIAGFSRGGGQSLFTGLTNRDKFANVGSFSAYLTPEAVDEHLPEFSADPQGVNEQLDVFWLGVGKADFLYQPALTFNKVLTDKKIDHEELVTEGGHTWMNARHYLIEFAQRLFK